MSEKKELTPMDNQQRKKIDEAIAAGEKVLSSFDDVGESLLEAAKWLKREALIGAAAVMGSSKKQDAARELGYAIDDLKLFRSKLDAVESPDGQPLLTNQFRNVMSYFFDNYTEGLMKQNRIQETLQKANQAVEYTKETVERLRGTEAPKPKQPQKWTRADELHAQRVRLGEIQEEKVFNRKRFAIAALIIIAVLAALIGLCNWRANVINEHLISGSQETLFDQSYESIYKFASFILIVLLAGFAFYALIRILAPKRRKPNRSFWGDLGIYVMLVIVAFAMAFPLIFSVGASLKPLDELFRFPPTVLPRHPTLDNFSDLFVTMGQSWVPFSRYLVNTVFITFVGAFGHVIIASMAAFVLAKYDFPGGKTFFSIIVTALMFSGYVTGIPNYVIMSRLKMIDTYWAILLPAFAAPIGLFLMKQFMESLPEALIEAAHLDGAGEIRIFWSIVMPNVKPAWLTITIFSVQNLWNTNAATVIYSEAKQTMVYALQQIQAGGIARAGQAAAVTVIVMLVPITVFILSQSHIMETMASSGLKD